MKTVAIHQSQYLPWLPYFEKVARSDVFIILDDVQFQKNGVQNRNQIKTAAGKKWLTVPIIHSFGQLIRDVRIDDNQGWAKKNWRSLEMSYSKAKYFDEIVFEIRSIYGNNWEYLIDLNMACFDLLLRVLGIQTEIQRASDLDHEGTRSELILGLCESVGADIYYAGQGSREYLDQELLEKAGVRVVFQEFEYPVYNQCYPDLGFVPGLSVIDLIFNCGPRSLEILTEGLRVPDEPLI